jgi:hypothetical protein
VEIKMCPDACPRCGGKTFFSVDCGPDNWEDTRTWTSYICRGCELYYSGWTDKWLVDCTGWIDEEDAEEYIGPPAAPAVLSG